jgi:glycosyltransferase involved in cell wall biosynthesis
MNLYYIINGRIPTEKANGYQVAQMCQAFEENGLSVELLRPKRRLPPEHETFRNDLENFYKLRTQIRVIDVFSIDFLSLPIFSKFQFFSNMFQTLSFVIGLAVYLKRKKSLEDSLYLRDVNILSWIYPLLNSHLKKNITLELHYMPEGEFKKKRYVKILRKAKNVVTITEKMKNDLVRLGYSEDRILTAHDGVDLDTFLIDKTKSECRRILNYPQNDLIIGYVGNFHTNGREKGLDDLIRCSVDIFKVRPDIKFYFVGGPLDRVPYYETIINELKLPATQFLFFGRRSIDLVPISMKACDVLVIPLPWNEHFAFYMSPLKLFEYMASGNPIVATDVDGLKEVLVHRENALLAKHSDHKDLALKVLEAIEDVDLVKEMTLKAMEQVKGRTWLLRAKRIIENCICYNTTNKFSKMVQV